MDKMRKIYLKKITVNIVVLYDYDFIAFRWYTISHTTRLLHGKHTRVACVAHDAAIHLVRHRNQIPQIKIACTSSTVVLYFEWSKRVFYESVRKSNKQSGSGRVTSGSPIELP